MDLALSTIYKLELRGYLTDYELDANSLPSREELLGSQWWVDLGLIARSLNDFQ